MKAFYLLLNLGSVLFPFLFSFHSRIRFHLKFPRLFLGIGIAAIVYIGWDIPFTHLGYWGFNDTYLLGIHAGIPLEEYLFFICIPFASLFTIHVLSSTLLKHTKGKYAHLTFRLIAALFFGVALVFYDHWYTVVSFALAAGITLIVSLQLPPKKLAQFALGFCVVLVPFFVVNGLLTGSWIPDQVVWYNDSENLGVRIGTIPVDDISYAWGMLLLAYGIMEWKTKDDDKLEKVS